MALEKDDPELYWFSPEERGVLPLESFNVPRGLKRAMKERPYTVTVDTDFEAVIRGCAEWAANARIPGSTRPSSRFTARCSRRAMRIRSRVWANPSPRRGEDRRGASSGAEFRSSPHPDPPPAGERILVGGPVRRFAGGGVLRREHVLPRARCQQDRAGGAGRYPARGGLFAARYAICQRPPETVRRRRGEEEGLYDEVGEGPQRVAQPVEPLLDGLGCAGARLPRRAPA